LSSKPPALHLPEVRREDYSGPWGPLVSGSLAVVARGLKGLVCVGDVVARYCLELGDEVESLVIVYDMKTRRFEHLERPAGLSFDRVRIVNERGTVSLEAYRLLCSLISLERVRVAIEVEGEEDMLALPAITCLKSGWAVTYGIPGKGACIVKYSTVGARIAQTRILQLKPPGALLV